MFINKHLFFISKLLFFIYKLFLFVNKILIFFNNQYVFRKRNCLSKLFLFNNVQENHKRLDDLDQYREITIATL